MSERSVGSVAAMVVLAVLAGVVVSAATPVDGRAATTGSGAPVATTTTAPPGDSVADQIETDSVRLTVDVRANGSAHWTVEYRTVLDDQNTTDAFESLQEDIEANRSAYVSRFAERINSTVRNAENATGREMTATNFGVETTIEQVGCESPNGCGVIRYTFRWDGFARVEDGGDRLAIGDAIEGFFLNENTRLEIGWPADYGRVTVEPEPDGSSENAVLWSGSSTEFVSGEPQVVVERGVTTTTTTTTTGGGTTTTTTSDGTTTTTTTEDPAGAGGGFPLVPIAVVALLVLAVGAAGAWWWTSGGGSGGPTPTAGDGGTPDGAAAAATATAGGDDEDDDEPFDIDQELLSNEEQVIKLLEANDGRLKQQEVVSELDWTEAKTSQVISGMRDEGSIDTFRLGRENVVTLPDEEIGIGPEEQDGE